jgi:hypothetical protein
MIVELKEDILMKNAFPEVKRFLLLLQIVISKDCAPCRKSHVRELLLPVLQQGIALPV